MADTFYLEVVSPYGVFYSGQAEEVIFSAIDGLHGVLAHHEPMVTALSSGELRYKVDGEWHEAIVSDGFVEIRQEYVILLAATAERPEEIDLNRARAAKERAEERLRQKQSQQEYHHSQASLSRAMARLKLGDKRY